MTEVQMIASAVQHLVAIAEGEKNFRKQLCDDHMSAYNIGAYETAKEMFEKSLGILYQLEQNLDYKG